MLSLPKSDSHQSQVQSIKVLDKNVLPLNCLYVILYFRTRDYDPPDKPGYFEQIVWPMHLKHLELIKDQEDIGVILLMYFIKYHNS